MNSTTILNNSFCRCGIYFLGKVEGAARFNQKEFTDILDNKIYDQGIRNLPL